MTTRAVAQAAGVHAPTIHRHLGDKDGLLDAVAEHEMTAFVAAKAEAAASAASHGVDPVEDLRAGWETYVGVGLAHPALFTLLADPHRRSPSPAAASGMKVLRARVRRLAAAGRLRVGERRAVELLHGAGGGAVLTLLATPPGERDPHLADAMHHAVARAILADAPPRAEHETVVIVVALRAAAPTVPALGETERALLAEWLDRTTTALQQPPLHPLRVAGAGGGVGGGAGAGC